MKKFLLSIFSILTLLTGVVFAGCGEGQTASAIVLESDAFTDEANHLIEIDLTEGANVSVMVRATIDGQENGKVQVVNNHENLECEIAYNQNLNTNTITITALEESNETAELIVKAMSGNVEEQKILVNTYSHMTAIAQKKDDDTSKKTQYIPLDEEMTLTAERYLDITARETCNKKDIVWDYAYNNNYGGALVIVGNKIRLDSVKLEEYETSIGEKVNTISILAQSKYQEAISTIVEFDVIKPIIFDKATGFTQSYSIASGFASVYDADGNMQSYELVRTTTADEHSVLYYQVSFKSEIENVSWVTLTDDVLFEKFGIPVGTLDVIKHNQSYDSATNTHTFIFAIQNEKSVSAGNYAFNFSFEYSEYDYTFETDEVQISLIDVVQRIEITSENNETFRDQETVDLYNHYANGKGLFFNVNLYPTTAKDTAYFLRVVVKKELAEREGFDLNDYFKIYTEADGLITFEQEEIDGVEDYYFKSTQLFGNATKLYAKAINTAVSENMFSISFVSNAKKDIKTALNLNFVYAPSENFDINEESQLDYTIETSELNPQKISIKCDSLVGRDLKDLTLDYPKSEDYSISEIYFDIDNQICFDITLNRKNINDKFEIWLCHKNGFKATKPINVEFFKALTSASVSLLNSNSNNIASYNIASQTYGGGVDNSLEDVVATFGSTLSLQFDHDANECLKGIELSYFVVDEKGVNDDIASIFNGDKLDDSKKVAVGYFSYNASLSSLTLLTTRTTFTAFVAVEFAGYDASHEDVKIYRIFKVDSYVPVSSLATKSTPVEMIASDSLSAQDAETLSKKTIEVSFRTDGEKISYYSFEKIDNEPYFTLYSASAKNDKTGAYVWDETSRSLRYNGEIIYSITDIESSDGRKLSFVINTQTTKDFIEFNDVIVLEYISFKSVYRLSIDLTIKNSDRVESVIWENETDDGELYILTRKLGDNVTENNKATIISTVQDAYNTKLAYKYIALNGASNVISFVENGKNVDVVSNAGASGGYGYIYVLPQDAVKTNEQVIFSYYDEELNIKTDKVQLGNLNDSCSIDGNESMTWFEFLTQKAFFVTNDGRVVSYGKILLKIKLTVADGLSEETAIRIYTSDEIQTMTSINHYILMNSVELSGHSSLYANADTNIAFKGSLRGYNSDIVITMIDNSSSLFGNLGEGGIVRDLTFNGSVKSSFVAETNLGTISNVTIDVRIVDGNYCPSEVNGYDNFGAGIVQNNTQKGKILSSKVLGANISGSAVGGIASKNAGTIDGCVVEFYNFKDSDGNKYSNKFKATGTNNVAGGIVANITQTSSVIQNSYVYDYTLSTVNRTSNISADTLGAIAGKCDSNSNNSKISNSFAVVNIENMTGSGTFDITDCYSGYFEFDTEWKYAVNKRVANDELWINDGDEDFNANTNGGFSHLKFAQSEKVDISAIEFNESNQRFIKVDETTAILYLYEVNTAKTLTNAEKTSLKNKNTYNLPELFNLTEEATNYVVVSSENSNLANAQLGKIELSNVGETQITLLSKQDFSTEKTFTIKVIHIIDDFKASYNGLETTGVEVQEGRNAQLDFTIKQKTYLNSAEEFNLVLDNVQIRAEELTGVYGDYISYSIENNVGSINVKSGAKTQFSSCIIKNYIEVEGLEAKYNDEIKKIFNKDITIIPFEGTNYISSDYSAISLYPSLSSTFEITLGTDSKTDDLIISLLKENTKLQAWKDGVMLSSRTINVGVGGNYEFAFGDTTKRLQIKISRKTYDEINKEYVYQFVVSICDEYKSSISTSEDYTLSLSSKNDKESEFSKDIKLTLESQKIENIEMTNYTILQVVNNNGTLNYTRSNNSVTLVAPGASSILEVNIDPEYSYYEYLTINYVPQNNQHLTFTALNKDGATYTPNLSSNVTLTANGLLWTPSEKQSSFAFKVYVSSNIKTDCVFPIVVSFYGYDENNSIILLESRQLLLYVTCVSQPQILVNGSEFTMLAKGSSADVEVTLESDQNLESLSFEGSVNGISLSTVAIVDNQDGTKTYKYKLNANVTSSVNGGLGQFGLKATVSRVLNGVRESKSMTAYVALVELEVDSVSIVNAEYSEEKQLDIVTAYENITKNFEFNYKFNPYSYGSNLSTEENQAVYGAGGLNEKRLLLQSQGYLEDNYYHINYTYDKAKDEWNEILFKDQLYIVGNNGREQKIVWTALDDNTYSYTHYEGSYAKFKLTFDKTTNKFTITGNSTTSGLVQMRIKTIQYITSAGKDIYWESFYDFAVQVKSYTSEDSPEAINNAKDFIDIQNEGEAKPYILMNDIVLEDYVPFDTSLIQSLDGNGYTIYLNSFDMSAQESSLKLALFTNVNANTILKNVRVNVYNGGQISIDTNDFTNVEIAGLAISNDGIIYNCEVVSFYNEENNKKLSVTENGIVVTYKRGSAEITIDGNYNITSSVAGFVLENSGNITNSRVGGTEIDVINETAIGNAYYKTIELGTFTIKAQGEVSGFVSSNTKNIISSKASNMQITNEANYNKFETAGFVNTNSGKIKSSYITGLEDGKNSFAFLSTSIESKGIIAGFVVNNAKTAEISDCMTNIKISTSSLFGAGFVYKNEGEIIYAFSASQVESSSFTQMGFTGLDAQGNLLSDEGKISFSYYYDLDYTSSGDVETTLDTGATALILQDSNNEKLYYGFSFASGDSEEERRENADGIWYFREDGKISIVSADTIAHSVRYIAGKETDNSFIYVYSDMVNNDSSSIKNGTRFTTELGSKYNPIIIATADDFDEAMGTSKSTNISKYFNSTEIFGSYRFVDDIDFDELDKNSEGGANVSSTSKSLVSNEKGIGLVDGNGFAIKNLSITSSDNSSISGVHSFGLFSKILNGAKVLNLTLEVTNVTAGDVYVVGSLAGLVYNSTIVGIHVDQKYLITPETSPESSENGVKGQNIAGGVVGAVVGISKIKDISIEDALVQVSYYDSLRQYGKTNADYYLNTFNSRVIRTNLLSSVSNLSTFSALSIAGGVVGYVDTFNENERLLMKYEHKEDTSRTYRVVNISATSTVNVRGEVVGGLIGYTSETTNTENARLVLSVDEENDTLVSKILSYNAYAGGITGLASGYYFRVYTTHDEDTQNSIESGYNEYYNGAGDEETRGILDLFYTLYDGTISYDYNTQVIGGLVGTFVAGEIENSYSKINVIAKTDSVTTAGGVVGRLSSTGERFNYELEIANGATVSTSLLLKEVYVTGDVRGGFTNYKGTVVGYGGGLVGQVDRQASLSLLAVNAVNAFGYSDITTSVETGASEATGRLSSVGVYSFVGGEELTRGTINILTAPSYDSNGEKSKDAFAIKSVGYFDHILNNAGETILIDKVNGADLRIEYISTKDVTGDRTERVFKIESVSEFTDVEDGFNSVLSAFTVGKHWNPNNWKSVRTKIYPEIRFSAIKTYLYLDNINKEEVLNKMRYSDVVVYVRGLNDDGTYSDVDLFDLGTVEGFSGQIIGPEGWLSVEEKEKGIIARISYQGEYVGIKINRNLFSNVGSGFTSRELRVEVGVEGTAVNGSGSIYVSGNAEKITIGNMEFNINSECIISPIGGSAGIICSRVSDSSIMNTKINIKNNGKITIKYNAGSTSELNVGLFVGLLYVGHGNNCNYNQISVGNDENTVLEIKDISTNCKTLNVGGLFGKVDKVDGVSEVNIEISRLDIKNLISISGNLSKTTANVGGQVGWMKNVADVSVSAITSEKTNFVTVESTNKIQQLNYGGIIGNIEELENFEISGYGDGKKLAETKLKYKTGTDGKGGADGSKIYAGGFFGQLGGTNISIGSATSEKIKASFEIGNMKNNPTATGAIGGIVGTATVSSLEVKDVDMKFIIGRYTDSSNEVKTDNSMEGINAHIGGIIGQNTATLAINNVDVSGTINAKVDDKHYVGGYVGYTTGSVYVNVEKTLVGGFDTNVSSGNSDVSINIISSAKNIGGVISYISGGTNIYIKKTLYSGTIQVYGDQSQRAIGGIVGFVSKDNTNLNITDSGFGGNIIAKGDSVNTFEGGTSSQNITIPTLAKLTIGGIVGDMDYTEGTRTNKAMFENCTSYGDAIIRYADTFKTITAYNFGGIVGEANNVTIKNCGAFMMNNNGRISTTTYEVGAFVGANNSTASFAETNLYSSALCLCVENNTNCKDIAYKTAFSGERKGYNNSEETNTAIEYIKGKITTITAKTLPTFAQGSKLNPYTTGLEIKTQSPIVYVVADGEANLNANNIRIDEKLGADTNKVVIEIKDDGEIYYTDKYYSVLAFIGDGFTVGIKTTDESDTENKAIFNEMKENYVVSSVVINAELEYDASDDVLSRGVIAHKMSGGTIFATGVYGSLSVGGEKDINLGGLVGNVENGLITESYTSVDAIYRATASGKVSGFANADTDGYVSILNSFSTGKVETYIDAPAYAFSYINGANVKVENCYTISPVDINNYTSANSLVNTKKVFGKGTEGGTYTVCYNDYNATGVSDETQLETTFIRSYKSTDEPTSQIGGNAKLKSGDFVTSKDYNYGYPMRNFGFLKRKTVQNVYALSSDDSAKAGKTYYKLEDGKYEVTMEFTKGSVYELVAENCQIIPNATKLNQISKNLSGNYVLEYDIDLSETEYKNGDSVPFIEDTFSGKLCGNGKTINGLKYKGLFSVLENATIDNLRLTNVEISSSASDDNIGAIARTSTGVTLLNKISVNGNIESNVENVNLGGLVGQASRTLTITNSQNYIRLVGEANNVIIGGFVGNADLILIGGFVGNEDAYLILNNCVNYGTIEAKTTGTIGGLVGYASQSLKITNSGNTNSVMCGYTDNQTDKIYIAGGIVGKVENSNVKISKSYNSAMVKAGHKDNTASASIYSVAGGIIGLQNDSNSHICKCLNQGPIEALGSTAHMTTSFEVSGIRDDSQITFTCKGTTNVYADAFANYRDNSDAILAKNSKNEANVFRNGCFGDATIIRKGFKFNVDGGEKGGFKFTENMKTGDYVEDGNYAGYRIGEASEVTGVYVTQTDDLGAPTSFFITVPRTIYYPTNTKTTAGYGVAFTRKQEIYANDEIDEADTYYALAHKANNYTGSGTSIEGLEGNSDLDLVTIAGQDYTLADTGLKLFNSLNANLYTTNPETISGDVTFTYSDGTKTVTKKIIDMLKAGGFEFRVENATCSDPKVDSVFGVVTQDDATGELSIVFKYTCSSKVTNPIISYDLVAENPTQQTVTVNVGANDLGYEKVTGKFKKTDESGNEIKDADGKAIYDYDAKWRTVIYLNNLFKEDVTLDDGTVVNADYFKENMTNDTTYRVKVGSGDAATTYNMLYNKDRNMFINYNSEENWVTTWNNLEITWNNLEITWDINQNKTLGATKTMVGITSDFTDKKAEIEVDSAFTKDYTLNIGSISGEEVTFTGTNISFAGTQTETATTNLDSTSIDKKYDKNESIDEYISGDALTDINVKGYVLTITPYYKKDSFKSTNVEGAPTVTTTYTEDIDGASLTFTYSGGNFIINGTTVTNGGTYGIGGETYKFEYVSGICKISKEEVDGSYSVLRDDISPTYKVTLDDETKEFTYSSGKFEIDGSEFASVYTTTNYTYQFTYTSGNVEVKRVSFTYTYKFNEDKTKEMIAIDATDANWYSDAQNIQSSESDINGTTYQLTYGTAKAKYSFDKTGITISQSDTSLTLTIVANASGTKTETTTPSGEDWVNNNNSTFYKTQDGDAFYLIFNPTEVKKIELTGSYSSITPSITIGYNITKVLAKFDVRDKTKDPNPTDRALIVTEYGTLDELQCSNAKNTITKDDSYQELNPATSYTVSKKYNVTKYSATYNESGVIEIPKKAYTTDTTISVYGKSDDSRYITDGSYIQININTGLSRENYDISKTDESTILAIGYEAVETYSASVEDKESTNLEISIATGGSLTTYTVTATIGTDADSSSLQFKPTSGSAVIADTTSVDSTNERMSFDVTLEGRSFSGYYYKKYNEDGKKFKNVEITGTTASTIISRTTKTLSKNSDWGLYLSSDTLDGYQIAYNPETRDVYFVLISGGMMSEQKYEYINANDAYYLSLVSAGENPTVDLIKIGSSSEKANLTDHNFDKDKFSINNNNKKDTDIIDVTLTFNEVSDPTKLAYMLQLENVKLTNEEDNKKEVTSKTMTGKITEISDKIKENYDESSFEITVPDSDANQVSKRDLLQKSSADWKTDGQYVIVKDDTNGKATIKVYPNEKEVNFTLKYYLYSFTVSYSNISTETDSTAGKSIMGTILTADVDLKNVADGISECKNLSGNGYNITYRANKNKAMVDTVVGFVKDVNIGGTNIIKTGASIYTKIGFFTNTTKANSTINNVKTYGSIVHNLDKPKGSYTGFANYINNTTKLNNITTSVNFASYYDKVTFSVAQFTPLTNSISSSASARNIQNIQNYGTIIGYDGKDATKTTVAKVGQSIFGTQIDSTNIVKNNGIIKAGDGGNGYANSYANFTNSSEDSNNTQITKPSARSDKKYLKGVTDAKKATVNNFATGSGTAITGNAGKDAKQGITGAYGVNKKRFGTENTTIYFNDGEKSANFEYNCYFSAISYTLIFGTYGYETTTNSFENYKLTQQATFHGNEFYFGDKTHQISYKDFKDDMYLNYTLNISGHISWYVDWVLIIPVTKWKLNETLSWDGYSFVSEGIIGCAGIKYNNSSDNKSSTTVKSRNDKITSNNYIIKCETFTIDPTDPTKLSGTLS